MPPIKKIQGGALLTALFIMTLVAIVATAMSTRLQLDIYRTQTTIAHDKLYLASQAVTFWAIDRLNNQSIPRTLDQKGRLAQYPQPIKLIDQQIELNGGLYDLQARFNLNNLAEKKSTSIFVALIHQVIPKINPIESFNIALAIQDWLSDYDLERGKDLYMSYYLSQKPAYYPSHQLMQSVSELRLIKNVSSTLYLTLEPFVTVLPETTAINVNTASKKLLMSLANGISAEQVNEIIKARGKNGIKKLQELKEIAQKFNLPLDQMTIESQYFLNVALVSNKEFQLAVYTLLKRSRNKQGILSVKVIRESFNGF